MLIGEYTHSIDQKRRLAIPSKLRSKIGERVVVTRGLDSCLFLFPMKEWNELAEKLGSLPFGQQDTRGFVRLILSGAAEVETDQLGRILIPDYLKEYAQLGKKVVIAGLFNRLEIWDAQRWSTYKTNLEKESDRIAEKLGELGVV
ncbi:MAG: cell division/cell wall cluster transcriptional repressor MraZ [Candidatus Yanofskybacteria bacterium CG10_big_fil_rev_8_21_14_0_10_46_23]|uniref:Transcriptional regulator MraZ n=1 Tax=Candidatus Yanofskybacteria bacterium CG10_big_fil_rev_8_21_14_0_10_46_23 TaxID=1975098 RepID=A0A2H0R4B5_9BACT|nr:MAG: cell division/cell wall cluster transcriptional repressor MraZ [Candidatus Yanofskybacteria bacterium CG10_big_fil_rev_8_21_14_0_10_46_23]